MKNLLPIALLALCVSGCAVSKAKKKESFIPTIGMSEADFMLANKQAQLVFLSKDSTVYKLFRGEGERHTSSDYYRFVNQQLQKFEKRTHYLNPTTIKVQDSKDRFGTVVNP